MYHQGIHISVPQVLELRRVAAYAAERKQSILFLPCHKSHIDYLTVSWLMFRLGIALPHIIAGENLDLPVLGDVLRKGGAFFIRRTFSGSLRELMGVTSHLRIKARCTSASGVVVVVRAGRRARTSGLAGDHIVDTNQALR